jgi:ATP/ADP translocase
VNFRKILSAGIFIILMCTGGYIMKEIDIIIGACLVSITCQVYGCVFLAKIINKDSKLSRILEEMEKEKNEK